MVGFYLAGLVLLAGERMFELAISRRHAAWAFERGGVEYGQGHYRMMKWLHVGFFGACAAEVLALKRPFHPTLAMVMLAAVLAAQGLRYWAIGSLGRSWNVRVIVVPGVPAVTRGPYRFLRHPNYLAVVVEMVAVPVIHTAWLTAILFSLLNAWMLAVRIRCEESALSEHAQYRERLGDRRRFFPKVSQGQA